MSKASVTIRRFDELSRDELYQALSVRGRVFVIEQQITSVPDLDGLDPQCLHVILREDGKVVGTCRLLPLDGGERIKMGRLAVLAECRGKGYAKAIFEAVHHWLGERPAVMHAQRYLEGFYASLGWQSVGEPFMEAGIEHIEMQRPARE